MKKYIIAALAVIAAAGSAFADDVKTVYTLLVNMTKGDQIEYAFEKKPVATFEGDNLVITTNDAPGVEYPMADVVNLTLKSKEVSGVEGVQGDSRYVIKVTQTAVTVAGMTEGEEMRIYSSAGALVGQGRADSEGNASVAIDNLAGGVYLVSLPGHNFKFVK